MKALLIALVAISALNVTPSHADPLPKKSTQTLADWKQRCFAPYVDDVTTGQNRQSTSLTNLQKMIICTGYFQPAKSQDVALRNAYSNCIRMKELMAKSLWTLEGSGVSQAAYATYVCMYKAF